MPCRVISQKIMIAILPLVCRHCIPGNWRRIQMVPRRFLRGPSRPAILYEFSPIRHDRHRCLHVFHGGFWLLGCQSWKQLHVNNGNYNLHNQNHPPSYKLFIQYFMMLLTIFISQIVLGSMGIVQMRNSDGVIGDRINGTTFEYFAKYHSDEDVRKRIDYYQYQVIMIHQFTAITFISSFRSKRSSFSHKFALFILDW